MSRRTVLVMYASVQFVLIVGLAVAVSIGLTTRSHPTELAAMIWEVMIIAAICITIALAIVQTVRRQRAHHD
jgi:NADH:ubiquinone oxidoreductase subunit K